MTPLTTELAYWGKPFNDSIGIVTIQHDQVHQIVRLTGAFLVMLCIKIKYPSSSCYGRAAWHVSEVEKF